MTDIWTFTNEELEQTCTQACKTYLSFLLRRNYITDESYQHLNNNTAMIIKQPTFFGKVWAKLVKNKDTSKEAMIVVEQVSLIAPVEEPTAKAIEEKTSE